MADGERKARYLTCLTLVGVILTLLVAVVSLFLASLAITSRNDLIASNERLSNMVEGIKLDIGNLSMKQAGRNYDGLTSEGQTGNDLPANVQKLSLSINTLNVRVDSLSKIQNEILTSVNVLTSQQKNGSVILKSIAETFHEFNTKMTQQSRVLGQLMTTTGEIGTQITNVANRQDQVLAQLVYLSENKTITLVLPTTSTTTTTPKTSSTVPNVKSTIPPITSATTNATTIKTPTASEVANRIRSLSRFTVQCGTMQCTQPKLHCTAWTGHKSIAGQPSQTTCAKDWEKHGDRCYKFAKCSVACRAVDVRAQCKSYGAVLTTVRSEELNQLIKVKLPHTFVWVGGREDDGGKWRWEDGKMISAPNYINWATGFPKSDPKYESCMYVNYGNDKWYSYPCIATRKPGGYVCEKPAGSV